MKQLITQSQGWSQVSNTGGLIQESILFFFFFFLFLAAWAFSSSGKQRLLFVVVHRLLIAVDSLAAEHRLSSCDMQA